MQAWQACGASTQPRPIAKGPLLRLQGPTCCPPWPCSARGSTWTTFPAAWARTASQRVPSSCDRQARARGVAPRPRAPALRPRRCPRHTRAWRPYPACKLCHAQRHPCTCLVQGAGAGTSGLPPRSQPSPALPSTLQHVAKGIAERDGHPCNHENLWLTDGASPAVHYTMKTLLRNEQVRERHRQGRGGPAGGAGRRMLSAGGAAGGQQLGTAQQA